MPEIELTNDSPDPVVAAGKGSPVGTSQQNSEQRISCIETRSSDVDSVDAGQAGLQPTREGTSPPNHISDSTKDAWQGLDTISTLQPVPQENSLTGWAKVEKALAEFDQQDVGAYKEDIDSLLVFVSCLISVYPNPN